MPSSKKPRKRYRPRDMLLNPVGYVLETFARLSQDDVLRMLTVNHDALTALVHGAGTKDHWRTVCGALNIAVVLDEQVYGAAHADPLKAALEAHSTCGVRHWNGGNFGYSGPDLQTVNAAMEIHDEQLRMATVGEIGRAVVETRRRETDPQRHYTVRERAEIAQATP